MKAKKPRIVACRWSHWSMVELKTKRITRGPRPALHEVMLSNAWDARVGGHIATFFSLVRTVGYRYFAWCDIVYAVKYEDCVEDWGLDRKYWWEPTGYYLKWS